MAVSVSFAQRRQCKQEIKKTTLTYDGLAQTGCIPIKTKASGLHHVIYRRCCRLFMFVFTNISPHCVSKSRAFSSWWVNRRAPCVLCHFLVLVIQSVYLQPRTHYFSVFSLSQALASHRAYLLTARIPTKVRTASRVCTVSTLSRGTRDY